MIFIYLHLHHTYDTIISVSNKYINSLQLLLTGGYYYLLSFSLNRQGEIMKDLFSKDSYSIYNKISDTFKTTTKMIDDIDNADDNNDIGCTLNILIKKVFHSDNKNIKKRIIASILLIAIILNVALFYTFIFYIIATIIF